ncbi:hypothetical protein TNCV_1926221 [Trichonephila clavipes]|nr:hypothetical protein TNCV_1926221 [Trichonephila clavipes]
MLYCVWVRRPGWLTELGWDMCENSHSLTMTSKCEPFAWYICVAENCQPKGFHCTLKHYASPCLTVKKELSFMFFGNGYSLGSVLSRDEWFLECNSAMIVIPFRFSSDCD